MMVQHSSYVSSGKGCRINSCDVDLSFLRVSREHFKMPVAGSGGTAGFGSPVLNHNDGLLLLKSISLDINPSDYHKELTTTMNTTTTNAAETTTQVVPPRLLSVEDIAKAMRVSNSYVYAIIKKQNPDVAMTQGKTRYYSSEFLEQFPKRQRHARRQRRIALAPVVQAAQPQQEAPTDFPQQPQQHTGGMTLVQRLEYLEGVVGDLKKTNDMLMSHIESLHQSLGV